MMKSAQSPAILSAGMLFFQYPQTDRGRWNDEVTEGTTTLRDAFSILKRIVVDGTVPNTTNSIAEAPFSILKRIVVDGIFRRTHLSGVNLSLSVSSNGSW